MCRLSAERYPRGYSRRLPSERHAQRKDPSKASRLISANRSGVVELVSTSFFTSHSADFLFRLTRTISSGEVGEAANTGGGIEHIATQATFRLLDRLGQWAAGRGRRHGGAGAAGGIGWPADAVRRG